MSGHSGWIGAALSSGQQISVSSLTLDQLFANTDSAAGNSGGSWFLSMLAYSPEFAADLSKRTDQWFTKGCFGNQRYIFAQAPNSEGLTATVILKDIADEITPVILIDLTSEVLASMVPATHPFQIKPTFSQRSARSSFRAMILQAELQTLSPSLGSLL